MKTIRFAPLPLLAAALLSACSDRLPSDAGLAPRGPLLTVTPTNAFVSIDVGSTHACGLTSGGQPWCWGRNAGGQLGDSTAAATTVPVATFQMGWNAFTSLTAGGSHSCGLVSSGQAWCWGYNGDGRLADGTTSLGLAPVQVLQGALSFTVLSGGDAHTCGLDSSGQAYCWGNNSYGQIGNNTKTFASAPTAVQQPAGVTFTQIAAAARHTCALTSGGQAYCWGYNGDGQVGIGSPLQSLVPAAVSQPAGVTFVSVYAEYQHSCGLTSGGQAYCWGLNSNGQLGDNSTTTRKTPVAVSQGGGLTFADLATGGSHTCGLNSSGQAYCWGSNSNGQLGIGSTTASLTPVAVSQPVGVTFADVGAGAVHSCALDGVGQAWCWGRNNFNQMGDGTSTQRTTPVAVSH
ncbi:MAG: RCC1 domain-containing protein [Longimicrobiaceae bacterium]